MALPIFAGYVWSIASYYCRGINEREIAMVTPSVVEYQVFPSGGGYEGNTAVLSCRGFSRRIVACGTPRPGPPQQPSAAQVRRKHVQYQATPACPVRARVGQNSMHRCLQNQRNFSAEGRRKSATRVSADSSEFLSEFFIPQANPTQPVTSHSTLDSPHTGCQSQDGSEFNS